MKNDKTNNLLTSINVGSIKWFKWLVLVWLVISDLYNFVSVILNVAPVGLLILDTAGFPSWAGTASLVALLVNT